MKKSIFLLFAVTAFLITSCNNKPATTTAQPEQKQVTAVSGEKMIVAKIFLTPGKEEEFIKAAQTIIESTHKEEGCLEYTLYQDPSNKSNLLFFERYKNQAAIDAHFAAPYFKEFGAKAADYTRQATEIKIYDISENK